MSSIFQHYKGMTTRQPSCLLEWSLPDSDGEAPAGVNDEWLGGNTVKAGSGIDLFPDLLELEDESQNGIQSCWMEDADIKQLLHNADGLASVAKDVLSLIDDDERKPLVSTLSSFLTPPRSPAPLIPSEMYFDQQSMDTIMATPLSPDFVSLLLDTPLEPEQTPITTNDTTHQLFHELVQVAQSMETLEDCDDSISYVSLSDDDIDGFTTELTILNTPAPVTVPSFDPLSEKVSSPDPSSPESYNDDPDYYPATSKMRGRTKAVKCATSNGTAPSSRSGARIVHPYRRSSVECSSKAVVDKDVRPLDRKERKKLQNKNAATRYREKKREEKDGVNEEVTILEKTNKELHDKVDQLKREIGYMKNLMEEVRVIRGKPVALKQLIT